MQLCRSSLVIGLLVLFAVVRTLAQDKSSSGCWTWPDSLDAVAADPQNHTVLYEDAKIRVLDVHTPPHTTTASTTINGCPFFSRTKRSLAAATMVRTARPLNREAKFPTTPPSPL